MDLPRQQTRLVEFLSEVRRPTTERGAFVTSSQRGERRTALLQSTCREGEEGNGWTIDDFTTLTTRLPPKIAGMPRVVVPRFLFGRYWRPVGRCAVHHETRESSSRGRYRAASKRCLVCDSDFINPERARRWTMGRDIEPMSPASRPTRVRFM